MDLNEFRPAGGLPRKNEVAEAVNRMAREREPSTSRLAATFSTPQAINHDELFVQAQKQARRAPQAPSVSPFQFEDGSRVQRMASAIDQTGLSPQRPEVHVQHQQARQATAQVRQALQTPQRARTRTPAPQPQPQPVPQPQPWPVPQPQPQPAQQPRPQPARPQATPLVTPLRPPAQPPVASPSGIAQGPRSVVSTPQPGTALGGQFAPLQPPSQAPVASPSPARGGVGVGVEIPVTPDVRPVPRDSRKSMEIRPAPENVSLLRPGTVSAAPAPGSALGGQFGRWEGLADRYGQAQAAGDRLGQRRVAHDIVDEMGRPARGIGDLGEEIA